ncbi:Ankyrin repeat and KH domain-containing protein R11A8.7 [Diplonema papillatum]|nr:Ankyrin repeat and KH domain-containing protein R11A8.7 [Diplonema papillatum]
MELRTRGKPKRGDAPLVAASANGHAAAVRLLRFGGAAFDSVDGATALSIACANGDDPVIEELLQGGVPINGLDKFGKPPLFAAFGSSSNDRHDLIAKLVQQGAAVDGRNEEGDTALIYASLHGMDDVVAQLLQLGAEVDGKSKGSRNTALIAACEQGNRGVIALLLAAGAKVDLRGRNRSTALIAACEGGCEVCVKDLLRAGASVHVRNSKNMTALIAANSYGRHRVVTALLEHKGG